MRQTKILPRITSIILLTVLAACAEVIEKSLTNEVLVVSAPVNNLISRDSLQTFHWDILPDAKSYQLQIVSPKFDSIATFITDTNVSTNLFLLHLGAGSYQWRVRATNLSSSTKYSEVRDLTIK